MFTPSTPTERDATPARSHLNAILEGSTWTKFASPSVSRGKTAWPKTSRDQEKFGVRYDYDGELEIDGSLYHKFEMQVNSGDKIPSVLKQYRAKQAKKGTHAVMANVYVVKDGGKDDVQAALAKAHKQVQGV
ncbi:hypothetical protein K525DRAFT_274584 [Schizophyllum commune Loenen D]|nr:hypothetical protein K525DRAFT_274584 [Schizophyllum commune Loenen D]